MCLWREIGDHNTETDAKIIVIVIMIIIIVIIVMNNRITQ